MRDFIRAFLLALLLLGLLLLAVRWALSAEVDVWWNPLQDPEARGYVLYYGPLGAPMPSRADVGPATNTTVSNLTVGRTYFFYLTAYDSAQTESDPSPVLNYTLPSVIRVTVSCSTDPTGTNWQTIFTETSITTNASWFYKVRITRD